MFHNRKCPFQSAYNAPSPTPTHPLDYNTFGAPFIKPLFENNYHHHHCACHLDTIRASVTKTLWPSHHFISNQLIKSSVHVGFMPGSIQSMISKSSCHLVLNDVIYAAVVIFKQTFKTDRFILDACRVQVQPLANMVARLFKNNVFSIINNKSLSL